MQMYKHSVQTVKCHKPAIVISLLHATLGDGGCAMAHRYQQLTEDCHMLIALCPAWCTVQYDTR